MTITLPEDLQKSLEAEVSGGYAESVDVVVVRATRAYVTWLSELRQSLDEAKEDYKLNGGIPWEVVKSELASLRADDGDEN